MNLRDARVVGFSKKETEHGQPAGTCDHCGTGIKYQVHVIDPEDGVERVIGTTCAEKIGNEAIRACVRERITEDERQKRLAVWEARQSERRQKEFEMQCHSLKLQTEWIEKVGDIVAELRDSGNTFLNDLGYQLARGALSSRQAHFAALHMIGARRVSKKNEEEYGRICDVLTGVVEE